MSGCTRNSRKDDRKIVAAYGISRLLDLFRERFSSIQPAIASTVSASLPK